MTMQSIFVLVITAMSVLISSTVSCHFDRSSLTFQVVSHLVYRSGFNLRVLLLVRVRVLGLVVGLIVDLTFGVAFELIRLLL